MKFPIAIEPATENTAYGVVIPDLAGCFSAGDTIEEAFNNAIEAIHAHCEFLAEDGQDIPTPAPLDQHFNNPEYVGWTWGMVEVDTSRYEGKSEKINITLPRNLLAKIDNYAQAHHLTRSAFLAEAARHEMR
ncbi:MAG: type II toxin-antitoxin system HicB family antitoxin [Formosimonas sp.]